MCVLQGTFCDTGIPCTFYGGNVCSVPAMVQCSFWTNFDNSCHSGRDATAAMHVALLLRIERGIFVNVHRTAYRAAGKNGDMGTGPNQLFKEVQIQVLKLESTMTE